ncbi:MAG: DUF4840 domain-containing protein [Flavobacteriaceae bacterium]|nr:DUF4840 domain-containing protein [Flavobacteriaceae bacterium]
MKNVIKIKSLLMILVMIGVGFVSCNTSDDNQPSKIVKTSDVNGSYNGKTMIAQGKNKSEVNIPFVAKEKIISFEAFPINEIVGTVVRDTKKRDEAIKKIGKVKYELDYVSVLNQSKTAVELTFSPKELIFKIPVENNKFKEVKALIKNKQKGIFTSKRSKVLKFELYVESITVDGIAESKFESIQYNFPGSTKK